MLSGFVQCALEKKYGIQQVGPSGPFVDKSCAVEFWEKICDVLVWNGEDCGVT